MTVAITYHGHLKEVQEDPALAALWARQTAPFDRLEWFAGMVDDCGLKSLFAVARADGEIALLPLARHREHLGHLGNFYTFRWQPLLSARGAALLSALARDLRRHHARITLAALPVDEGSAALVTDSFRAAGWLVFKGSELPNHVLAVAGRAYGEYLAQRPGKLRTTLKRKAGKLRIALHDDFDATAWADYEEVYATSWKPAEFSMAFWRNFAIIEAAAGRLRMGVAYADGAPVAAQLWTVEGGTAYIHKLAHTRESTALSPGTVLSAALFARVIDHDRVTLIDFGTGDDPYKRDWMESVRTRVNLELIDPARPANWPRIARHEVMRALRRLALARRAG